MMTPDESSKTTLILEPKSVIIAGDYSALDNMANPDYNKFLALVFEWRVKRIPSNELIELLLDGYMPIDMRKQIQEAWDEGEQAGSESAWQSASEEYESKIPCQDGLIGAISLMERIEERIDSAVSDLEQASADVADIRGDMENYQSDSR